MGDLVTVSGKVNSMEEFIFFWYYDTVFRKKYSDANHRKV